MKQFQYALKNDYDKRVKIQGESILCYSEARFKTVNPEADKTQLHEARSYSASEKKPPKQGGDSKYQKQAVGEMEVGPRTVGVAAPSTNNSFLYKKIGYVCMEDGSYVALCASRIPFFSILGALVAVLAALVVVLILMLGKEEPPPVVPDNPLPPIDNNLVPDNSGEEDEKPTQSPEGGGSVSMIYTLSAKITLSNGDIAIHFKNPKKSNHSVAMEFYIVSGGNEYLVAKSGLIPAGNGLYTLKLSEDAPKLTEGTYNGLYRVMYYDPITGVRAHVQSDISDVIVAVKP